MIGTSLGPYKIIKQLGVGGMGEVYLGEDTRLGRKVAIKVLPAEFASDPERLARFEQEARAAAALNHPHIAAVFDVGTEGEGADAIHFMVQELLEGDTLRVPLDKGALGAKKALTLATELAEALTAAHAAGIVHRDLKPANIFITKDGHAKVLDFGLAKLTEVTPAMSSGSQASQSPTMLGTMAGQIMGTAGYMAPEQISGDGKIDHRDDIFAFGCLLYEMVTGRRAFTGKNVFETLGQIVSDQPRRIDELDHSLPPQLQWIVDKCLAKEPADRYQSAADLVVDVRTLAAALESGNVLAGSAGSGASIDSRPAQTTGVPWMLAVPAALALIAIGAVTAWFVLPQDADTTVRRFEIEYPVDNVTTGTSRGVAVSPDGRWIVFSAGDFLWLRQVGNFEAAPIRGSEGRADHPVFSPDSRYLAFWNNDQLWRSLVQVGAPDPVLLADARSIPGMSWADDGHIYYGQWPSKAIWRVDGSGGTPEMVMAAEVRPRDASLLPGGEWLLYTSTDAVYSAWAYSTETEERKLVVENARDARYIQAGYLVFLRDGDLLAQRFDASTAEVEGEPVTMVQGVRTSMFGTGDYGITDDGDLVYRPGASGEVDVIPTWLDRDGTVEPLPIDAGRFDYPALSPDDSRLAIVVDGGETRDIWIYEVESGREQRLTTAGDNGYPVWSPDGDWVYFSSALADGDDDIWRRRSDLSADAELVLAREGDDRPTSISPDGQAVLFVTGSFSQDTERDLLLFEIGSDSEPRQVMATEAQETWGDLSPDGRFVAYVSNIGGGQRLYVAELETNSQWPVSTTDAGFPRWSLDGEQLFFESVGSFWSAGVTSEPEFAAAEAVRVATRVAREARFDVSADGTRILSFSSLDDGTDGADNLRVRVVFNWVEEVKERLPTGR